MKCLCILSPLLLATPAVFAQVTISGADRVDNRTPVQISSARDTLFVTLPGTSAPTPKLQPAPPTATPERTVIAPDDDHRPVLRRAPKPVLPAEFEKDSAAFSHQRIGEWTAPDAYNMFGEPLRSRAAIDDDESEIGEIFAYSDPTGRYREIELDFAKDTGLLRSVFVYPWKMTWQDCRKLWGANVRSTDAPKGRTFYSYMNRHVDVLVDSTGRVISFGLY